MPVTKLGRLVKAGLVRNIDDVFNWSIPIKEPQIIDTLVPNLKDEVMSINPVQKQTTAGQRTRFKAYVAVGDGNHLVGLGDKCAKEVANAIRGAILAAKLSIVRIQMGHWGGALGRPHTVPMKVTGKCGSVRVRLIPAPRGTGLVAAPIVKKFLGMAGLRDVYTSSSGHTRSTGNFVKAVFKSLVHTQAFMTPDNWNQTNDSLSPFQLHTDFLKSTSKVELERQKLMKSEVEHEEMLHSATTGMGGGGGVPQGDVPLGGGDAPMDVVTETTVVETVY